MVGKYIFFVTDGHKKWENSRGKTGPLPPEVAKTTSIVNLDKAPAVRSKSDEMQQVAERNRTEDEKWESHSPNAAKVRKKYILSGFAEEKITCWPECLKFMSSILFAPSGHMTEDEYVQHREREVKRTQRRANTRYRKKRHRFTFRVNAK